MRGGAKGGAALGMGAPGPFVTILRILEPWQQLVRPEPLPEQIWTWLVRCRYR